MGSDAVCISDRRQARSETYGIIAAQRRESGALWIVVAGVTGPGTYAASRLLGSHPGVPNRQPAEPSAPIWTPVIASVCEGEPRETATVADARLFPPGDPR